MSDKWAQYKKQFCGCKDASRLNSCSGLQNCSLRADHPERKHPKEKAMSEFVLLKRELLEELLGSAQAEAAERRAALGDFRPQVQAELDRVVAETRAVLAQEAGPVVERQPVAIVDESDDGLFIEFIYGENGNPLQRGDMLYTSPPAPVSVALPGRREQSTHFTFSPELNAEIKGWNACLDKVKELNQ